MTSGPLPISVAPLTGALDDGDADEDDGVENEDAEETEEERDS